jgi:superfamily II DNA or RNA helicase
MQLRPYQESAINAICAAYDQNWRHQILSMATGCGKTVVFSNLYEKLKSRLPGKMLILAHTEELIDQSIATMQAVNPTLRIDKEMAEHKSDPSQADVIVASVATLGRLNTSRLDKFKAENIDKIIVDEAQHTPAQSYLNVLDALQIRDVDTSKLLLGVTATPSRTDGKALGEIYKKMTYVYSLRQAIEDGYLVEVRGYKVSTGTSLADVSTAGGDFNKVELEAAINTPERNKAIIGAWQEKGDSRSTVAFVAGIAHAKALSEAFNAAGVFAAAVWGDDPDRTAKLQAFREGGITVLVNCNVLTEGVDIPRIGCVIIARPTRSSVLFTQMCGRGTRLAPGKADCIILDIVDCSAGNSLCTLPLLMGLPGGIDMRGHGLWESVKLMEAAQEENPSIDFGKLKTIDNLKQFIAEVNLFEIRFPAEVEANSDFIWSKAIDGGYVMRVPLQKNDSTGNKPGLVRIHQNLLDKWDIDGYINCRVFHGERGSVEEAFACADQQIRERAPASVVLVNRKASWMTKPATKGQMNLLSRLYGKARAWPEDFTQGQASFWINKRIGGKK